MPWYKGPSLLELLESLPSSVDTRQAPFRFPVQRVLRPNHTFRGFAGQIGSGTVRPGDTITVLPSGRSAQVQRIVTYDGDLAEAYAPLSVTLVLDREIDVSRGDLIVSAQTPARVARGVQASLVWMDQRPLLLNRRYLFKHTSQTVPVVVSALVHRTDVGTLSREPAQTLQMNDIGTVSLTILRPIALDSYGENRATGAFILIDTDSNSTVAAGMITSTVTDADKGARPGLADGWGRVTAGERDARWGHRGGVLEVTGPLDLLDAIERSLFSVGVVSCRIDVDDDAFILHPSLLEIVTRIQFQSGLLALVVRVDESGAATARTEGEQVSLDATDSNIAIAQVHQLLHSAGIFIPSEKAGL
jgi:sulfate adenylyltransferase subunit 1